MVSRLGRKRSLSGAHETPRKWTYWHPWNSVVKITPRPRYFAMNVAKEQETSSSYRVRSLRGKL